MIDDMQPRMIVKKPVSVLMKPLKVDYKGLFKGLAKAARDGFTGRWAEMTPDIGEVVAALDLKTEPGSLAWLLIRQALLRTLHAMLGQVAHLLNTEHADPGIGDRLDEILCNETIEINKDFFHSPGQLQILDKVEDLLTQWLLAYGLNNAQAVSITRRLRTNFLYILNQEWRENSSYYLPILQAADTPFLAASERELSWSMYNSWLQQQVEESLFQEPFSLNQVYIKPRAYFESKNAKTKSDRSDSRPGDSASERNRQVIELESYLIEWLNKGNRQDALRVISGGPGSGKSCFAKMFAAKLAQQGLKVLYLPLHLLDAKAELVTEVGRVLKIGGFFSFNPMAPDDGEDRLFVIFDGLDELAMLGKIAENIAQAFIRAIDLHTSRRNQEKLHLQVLITSRTVVIEGNALEFRNDGQVLHILPYVEESNDNYIDPSKLLAIDQRHDWWRLFGQASGKNYQEMPELLKRKDLEEITAQPLLCMLVALSFERERVDFSQAMNLNTVYADLLDAIYDRPWGDRKNFAVKGMQPRHFCRVLEEIGLAAWHGDGRSTTVKEIREHCESANLAKMLDVFQEGAEAGVTRLLTAFYFRQNSVRNDQQSFEFTHKSFGEYLAARRIVGTLDCMSEEFKRHGENPDRGWDAPTALNHWALICGPATLEPNIVRFLRREIALKANELIVEWQHALCQLIGYMLRKGMPMQMEKTTYGEATRQARNAEEALLVVLNACAKQTGNLSKIDWPTRNSFGTWLRRLQPQRDSWNDCCLAMNSLGYIDLKESTLIGADLATSELEYANLSDASLFEVDFWSANLQNAILQNAKLESSDFRNANLNCANLKNANLKDANLKDANLEGADLEGADLEGANLKGANLKGTNLKGANLEDANLKGANLKGANLEGANLEGANLVGEELEDEDLEDEVLEGEKLEGEDL